MNKKTIKLSFIDSKGFVSKYKPKMRGIDENTSEVFIYINL